MFGIVGVCVCVSSVVGLSALMFMLCLVLSLCCQCHSLLSVVVFVIALADTLQRHRFMIGWIIQNV